MKMGTILLPWHYELEAQCRDSVADLATLHDFALLSNIARTLGRTTVNGHSHSARNGDWCAATFIGPCQLIPLVAKPG
jgi:hypothetical protein